MHHFPFTAQISDRLFELVERTNATDSYPARGYLPFFELVQQCHDVPGVGPWSWMLGWIPEAGISPQRVFCVDGVSFYISVEAESALRGRVLDWSDERGVIAHANAAS